MDERYKIHVGYIISILISIIVVLITVQWGDITALVEHINFALTLTSLVLAVLAIVYSMYSNTNFTQNVASLDKASADLASASSLVQRTTTELAARFDTIPGLIANVEQRMVATHSLVEAMMKQPSPQPVSQPPAASSSSVSTEHFLRDSSYSGALVLYASMLACRKKVPFDLSKLVAHLPYIPQSYFHGFLVAAHAGGFLRVSSAQGLFNVTSFSDVLAGQLESGLDAKLTQDSDKEFVEALQNQKAAIDTYFSV